MKYLRFIILFLAGATATGCVHTAGPSLSSIFASSPFRQLGYYHFDPNLPPEQRVRAIPADLLRAQAEADRTDRYSPYVPNISERELLAGYLQLLPDEMRRVIRDRLIAFYFVNDFMGSGMTDYLLDEKGEVYVVVYLNPEVLRNDISTWLTQKESTAFYAEPGTGVKIDCGTKYKGLMYILLHEGAHMVDFVEGRTPFVERNFVVSGRGTVADNGYTKGIWKGYDTPVGRYEVAKPGAIAFYDQGEQRKIQPEEAVGIYRNLARTPFVSLYGTLNWAEDFAELTAFHYLTETLGQPYRITVHGSKGETFAFSPMSSKAVRERTSRGAPER